MVANLYETDFYAWTLEQSQLLKDGELQKNLAKIKSRNLTCIVYQPQELGTPLKGPTISGVTQPP